MYNLLVGFADATAPSGRVFEYTDQAVLDYLRPGGAVDLTRLSRLPTLVMPETGFDDAQVARVGRITDLTRVGADLRFRFMPSATVPGIPTSRIQGAAAQLEIADWEFTRTHWAVKAVDLYGVLGEAVLATTAPRVFQLPVDTPRDSDLVAVMMPFNPSLTPVYEALRNAATQAGFRSSRADDIWENAHIMDDILSLIWRSRTVIADFTGKNPNVFYETGIAHTIGRDVIQITQTIDDVPFDLRPIRTLTYLNNGEGRSRLTEQVAARLQSLAAQP